MKLVKKFKFLSVLVLSAVFVFAACAAEKVDDGKIHVVTTVGMAGDLVENVGGDRVSVTSLMGPGVDPHLYKASAGDIQSMEDADIVFYVGLHLEGKMGEIFESLAERKKVVATSDAIERSNLLSAQAGMTGNYDPHIWFDVEMWAQTIFAVRDTLTEIDPEGKDFYFQNAESYYKELADLHVWVGEQIQQIPEDQRVLITAHDAFNYFGMAYGMEVRGLQGISTASDYGLKDLEEMINFIVQREIKAVFVESSVPKKSIEALQQGVKAKGFDVQIGGELFSDAMGDAGSAEGTYIGMVKHNVNTIVNALK